MGASGWYYFVPFDPDPQAALQRLREDVFRRGQYFTPKTKKPGRLRSAQAPGSPKSPRSIDELLMLCKESGTHSILDVDRLVTTPHPPSTADWMRALAVAGRAATQEEISAQLAAQLTYLGTVGPVAEARLQETCGSHRPERAALEAAVFTLISMCPRGAGMWTTVYDAAGAPSELLFLGKTGE
jgi:hypothetical protein